MKRTAGLMCLGSFYAGALWTEYQIALLFGTGCFLLVGVSALAVMAVALRRAPEGYERPDGFHVPTAESAGELGSSDSILSTGTCATMK